MDVGGRLRREMKGEVLERGLDLAEMGRSGAAPVHVVDDAVRGG